jgi:hypothetical protein
LATESESEGFEGLFGEARRMQCGRLIRGGEEALETRQARRYGLSQGKRPLPRLPILLGAVELGADRDFEIGIR